MSERIQNALRRNGLVDRSERLLAASGLVTEKRKILVYGYFRARKEELLLIDALAGDGSFYHLPCGANPVFDVNNKAVTKLVDRGWEVCVQNTELVVEIGARVAAGFAGLAGREPRTGAFAFPDIDKEVRSTLAAVKRLLRQGVPPESIAVVARDMEKPTVDSLAADETAAGSDQPLHTIGTTGLAGL